MSALDISLNSTPLCAGIGQHHTNSPEAKNRKPYKGARLNQILRLMSKPRSVAKDKAPWVIFSNYMGEHGRSAEYQRKHGEYFALWADIDEAEGIESEDIISRACGYAGSVETWIYSSRSATQENQKARLIFPLAATVDGETFELLQEVLNNKLGAAGLKPDRVTERANQLCYLPNKGEFYYSAVLDELDEMKPLDPNAWADEVAALKAKYKAEADTAKVRTAASKQSMVELIAKQGFLPRAAAAQAYDSRDLWIAYGGKAKGSRVLSPHSSSGAAAITFRDGKWFSSHGSDVSAGIGQPTEKGGSCFGDAFDLIAFFEYGNDTTRAAKELSEQLDPEGNKQRQIDHAIAEAAANTKEVQFDVVPEPEQAETRNAGTYAEILKGTQLGQLAIEIADDIQMPRDTTLLAALGVASAPVSMLYKVGYMRHGDVPASVYIVTEQPASSGKSAVLNAFTRPIQRAIAKMNSTASKAREEAKENDSDEHTQPNYRPFLTDTTPEALESMLLWHHGHFCLASAEQGLVNTILGVTYGDGKKSNNDLMLKGYSGEHHSSARVTRQGYDGDVFGSVTVIAQRGTIETILEQSDGTGIAERFIMEAEPTLLGYRDHLREATQPDPFLSMNYDQATARLIKQYEAAREAGNAVYENLQRLALARSDWDIMNHKKQELEPLMADGGRYSHEMLRGVVGKYDQRVMKLAAVLHVIESSMDNIEISGTIKPEYVAMAMQIANLSIERLYGAMSDKGLIGMNAEQETIYRIVSGKERGILWDALRNAARNVSPFKEYPSKGRADKIKSVCEEMVRSGKITFVEQPLGGRTVRKFHAL